MEKTNKPPVTWSGVRIPTLAEKLTEVAHDLVRENERLLTELQALRTTKAMEKKPEEPRVQEKESKGYKMTSLIGGEESGRVVGYLFQDGRRVFSSQGFRSKEQAERILRQLRVEYALVEMPSL